MTVVLWYPDGEFAVIEHVESIQLRAHDQVVLQTFGNQPTLNRNIVKFYVWYPEVTP